MGRKRKRESKQQSTVIQSSSSPASLPRRKKLKWGSDRYSTSHRILLVGEGDFSFSLSLAKTFGSANNIVATSKDSQDAVQAKFGKAKQNLEDLQKMGAVIFHEVDATTMDQHNYLKIFRFDRIIFNFPHAGFKGKEDQMEMINLHRQLVFGFFRAAANMIKPRGEIHVSHKIGDPYDKWELKELASECSLQLIKVSEFRSSDYPGYSNKRGAGKLPDLAFHLGSCCTFKFKIYDARRELDHLRNSFVPGRLQESIGMDFYGEKIPGDYRTFIKQNCTRTGGFGNPLLFDSPGMVRMRDDDQFFTSPKDYCTLSKRSYTQTGGVGNPVLFNSPSMVRLRDDDQLFISPRVHSALSERNYARTGGLGNSLLFDSPNMARMKDDNQFFASPSVFSTLSERNYAQTGGFGNSLLFDSPSMTRMKDDNQFFASPRDYCTSSERNYTQTGGFGNRLQFDSPGMVRMRDDDQYFASPRDYCTLSEGNYTQTGNFGNPLLFNSPSMMGMTREDGFCKTEKYSNGEIIVHSDHFFAMRRTYCAQIEQYLTRRGHGILPATM